MHNNDLQSFRFRPPPGKTLLQYREKKSVGHLQKKPFYKITETEYRHLHTKSFYRIVRNSASATSLQNREKKSVGNLQKKPFYRIARPNVFTKPRETECQPPPDKTFLQNREKVNVGHRPTKVRYIESREAFPRYFERKSQPKMSPPSQIRADYTFKSHPETKNNPTRSYLKDYHNSPNNKNLRKSTVNLNSFP